MATDVNLQKNFNASNFKKLNANSTQSNKWIVSDLRLVWRIMEIKYYFHKKN